MEILRTSAQKKFPACVDLRTKCSNTQQTSAGKCPQFSMRNITFFVDISGTGSPLPSSLREIFPTDAGQLSDRLQSFAGQKSIYRTEGIFVVRILFSLPRS